MGEIWWVEHKKTLDKMKKIVFLLFGIFFTGMGVEALITGDTWLWGESPNTTIAFDKDPIEFYLVVFSWLGVGGSLLYRSFKGEQ